MVCPGRRIPSHCSEPHKACFVARAPGDMRSLGPRTLSAAPPCLLELSRVPACAGNTALRELRLFGSSSCTQRSMLPLAALRCMTRLVIGHKFFRAPPGGRAASSRACSSRQAAAAMVDGGFALDTTFKRMLAGLMPQVHGALHVLALLGPLGDALRAEVAQSSRLRGLLVGLDCWSHHSAAPPEPSDAGPGMDVVHPVLPQPFGRAPGNPPQWDTWPYDCPSDDEEYGANVPAWLDVTAQPLATLSDDEMAGMSDGEGSIGAAGGGGGADSGGEHGDLAVGEAGAVAGAEDDDEEEYHFGHFYDPFTGRMVRCLDRNCGARHALCVCG